MKNYFKFIFVVSVTTFTIFSSITSQAKGKENQLSSGSGCDQSVSETCGWTKDDRPICGKYID